MINFFIYTLIVLQYVFLLGMLAILAYIAFIMLSFRDTVPYVPSPTKIIRKMIQLAEIKKGQKICDLGSGTGRIIIAVAKKHQHNLIVGIEKSFILRVITKIRLFLFHPIIRKRIQVIKQDFFNADLTNFDVLFCFLTPEAMRILTPKFRQLKRGSKIVSYTFPIEEAEGFIEKAAHPTSQSTIFYYEKL